MLSLLFIAALIPTHSTTVRQLTGAGGMNPTHEWAVGGTDLGTMWDSERGWIYSAHGDTVHNPDLFDIFASNMLLWSGDTDPSNGIDLIPAYWNGSQVLEFLPGHNVPVTGIAVNGRQYVHYQSMVTANVNPYIINWASIAYSDEAFGHAFVPTSIRWGAHSNFAQGAFVKRGGYVYLLGTVAGRVSNVRLARVPETQMLTQSAWRYYAGAGVWSPSESAAIDIAHGQVGEMSAYYSSYFNRYIMLYWSAEHGSIVMRDAASMTGPWTGERVLARNSWDGIGYYAPYVHPWFTNYWDLYYQVSEWSYYNLPPPNMIYNTFLKHSTLAWDYTMPANNMVSDSSFEEQEGNDVRIPWSTVGAAGTSGIDHVSFQNGVNSVWLRASDSQPHAVKQDLVLDKIRSYTASAYIRSGSYLPNGRFLIKNTATNGTMASVAIPPNANGFYSFTFNSGANVNVTLSIGFSAGVSESWLKADSVRVY